MKLLIKEILILILLSGCNTVPGIKYNFVTIEDTYTPVDIIWKAANVIPSEQHLRWHEMELITHSHFGMNSFIKRESSTLSFFNTNDQ